MYGAPSVFFMQQKYTDRPEKDVENKGVKETDNCKTERKNVSERMKKTKRWLLLYLICIRCHCILAETVCPGL